MLRSCKCILVLIGAGLVSCLFLSTTVFADDTVIDDVAITVPISCTMSGSGMTSHTAEIPNGTSNSSIGETVINALCNDDDGFAIYAIGYTDDTDGKNVLTSSVLGSTNDIVTGIATSGNTSNWAMKLSTVASPAPNFPITISGSSADLNKETGDPDYSAFQPVPANYTKVAYRESSTDMGTNAEGSTFKTTYQAYISNTQKAGTYEGKVKYTMVHPSTSCVSYTLHFNAGTGSGTMSDQTICVGTPTAIATGTFTPPTGSDLIGWSTGPNGTGTLYNTGQILTDEANSGETINLYARYGTSFDSAYAAAGKTRYNNSGYYAMQDMSSTICSNTTVNQETQLIDTRDGKVYYVAKLGDGNCWMVQNLDHDIDEDYNYTSANTDLEYGLYSVTRNDTLDGVEPEVDYDPLDEPYSFNPGDYCWNGSLVIWPDTIYDKLIACTDKHYHIGNLYNWSAATDANQTDVMTDSDYAHEDIDVNQSICPAKWTLPKDELLGDIDEGFYAKNTSGTIFYLLDQMNYTRSGYTFSEAVYSAPSYFVSIEYQSSVQPSSWDIVTTYVDLASYNVEGQDPRAWTRDARDLIGNGYPNNAYAVRCVAR